MPPKTQDLSSDPLEQIAHIAECYDSKVRLLFQLRNYISLVRYDPVEAKRDKSAEFRRFVTSNELDLWDSLHKKSDTRKTFKRLQSTRKEVEAIQAKLKVKARSNQTTEPKKEKSKQVSTATRSHAITSPRTAESSRVMRQENRATKRKERNVNDTRPSSKRGPSAWTISSDLCWPTQPPSSKRIRHNNTITNPTHFVKPAFKGDLDLLLSSYKTISDDQEPIGPEQWQKRVETDAESLIRVTEAKRSGLLAELEEHGVGSNKSFPKFIPPPPKEPSHFENLLSQAVHYAKLRSNLRKFHSSITKRNSQSIEQYFRRLVGAEDRERKEIERQIRQIARRTGQEVMKKWKLAMKIVEQRREAILAEERREKGKEYLNQILDNSAKLIEARLSDAVDNAMDEDGATSSAAATSDSDLAEDSEDNEPDNNNENNNDEYLTIEQLRDKYKDLEHLSDSDSAVEEEEEEEDDDDASDSDGSQASGDESDEEKPSEEALRLYAEVANEVGSDTSGEEEESPDGLSDSASESESGSEATSVSADEGPGLAALLGNVEDDGDQASYSEKSSSEEDELDETVTEDSALPSEPAVADNSAEVSEDELDSITNDQSLIETKADAPPVSELSTPQSDLATPEESDTKTEITEVARDEESNMEVEKHKIEPPFLLRGTLREYQRNGLDWLAGLVQSGTNGILADEMGLGKTIQTIALLAWLACEKQIWGPHLIIVPTSVMLNWEMEFKRFAPGFKILTYYGTPQQRKRKRRGWNKEDTWHVCITSYQLVIQDQVVFRGKKWQFMVLDEAHNIKNFRSQRWQALLNFNAQYRLLLTGTPLQNNLVELWSLLYFLMPSSRASQMMPAGFASLDDFQEWFAKPVDQMVEEGESADDEARKTISKLHQVLRPYLLRRLKIDVEKQMPAKYEHIVYCRLSKRQRYLYDDFMSRASTQETLESGNFMSILNCLMQLRKVCNHPDLFEVRPIVTSLALDNGVYSRYRELVAPKFTFLDLPVRPELAALSLVFTNSENQSRWAHVSRRELNANAKLQEDLEQLEAEITGLSDSNTGSATAEAWAKRHLYNRRMERINIRRRMLMLNWLRINRVPIYGSELIKKLSMTTLPQKGVLSLADRENSMKPIISRFAFVTPPVVILDYCNNLFGKSLQQDLYSKDSEAVKLRKDELFHEAQVRLSIAFPDKRLLQYDCGKLQKLAILLRELIIKGHRCLIFTQMTRVLDILEQFLNLHGWRYLRLDGATKIEQRQALTERFNKDATIPVFILSTRSGGLGINLTGADTVIFYDSDWNPAMDRQCQDRCHRIGQTRDVHIYRLVSEYTIESNILRKATQKTILDNVVIQEGDFTTDHFTRMSVQDILGNDAGRSREVPTLEQLENRNPKQLEAAMAEAEDKDDQLAANLALSEARMDQDEFDDNRQGSPSRRTPRAETEETDSSARNQNSVVSSPQVDVPVTESSTGYVDEPPANGFGEGTAELGMEPEIGHIDDWMIRAIERGDLY